MTGLLTDLAGWVLDGPVDTLSRAVQAVTT